MAQRIPTLLALGALVLSAAPVQGMEVASHSRSQVEEMDAMPMETTLDTRPTARERRLARRYGREGTAERLDALSVLRLSDALGNRNDLELGPLATDFPQDGLVGGGLSFVGGGVSF